jgi:hypothetical protein
MFLWQYIHNRRGPVGVAFSDRVSKKLYEENCQEPEPEISRMRHIRKHPHYQRRKPSNKYMNIQQAQKT